MPTHPLPLSTLGTASLFNVPTTAGLGVLCACVVAKPGPSGITLCTTAQKRARTPAEAIDWIRVALRAAAPALPPQKRRHVLSWADGDGHRTALSQLERGEPYGISVYADGGKITWKLTPHAP
ncbi:hypothetical protein LRS74_16985 [Streptomyces sp. LX-29]|uniref:hypothetical protein n=1 Tax=Streptomyces sp. LX-29 TaxID=2900152 RepID=UPI00240E5485|nr:hypothetical protein [Streptomyces sp. LX-29]WFB08553.1 hypothetical protein LRS74_16985 [Streptomyces sp. LX-29]